jgi:DNA polymerase-3 subunit delta'
MLLRRAVAEGRIGQSIIMAGQPGVGKHQFALALAQALNCERPREGDACGECVPCRKIAAGEHADVETISPDGQFIKVDQMRQMSAKAQYLPYEGKRRVYIVDAAERLNDAAANSILKIVEEPPATTLIIFTTSRPYRMLETIRSRCLMLSFAPLTPDELEAFLKSYSRRPAEEIRMLARLARGSIGRALSIDLGEVREKRASMMELIDALAVSRDTMKILSTAEYLGKKLERDEFEVHMDALLVLFADMFHLKIGEPAESLTNSDIAERLQSAAETVTLDEIIEWVESVEKVLKDLQRNVNRQLAIESAFIRS